MLDAVHHVDYYLFIIIKFLQLLKSFLLFDGEIFHVKSAKQEQDEGNVQEINENAKLVDSTRRRERLKKVSNEKDELSL